MTEPTRATAPSDAAGRPTGRTGRTRLALIDAGRRLFGERPVDAVTIDDIVQAAGVGKGTFYNHFPDRDALMATIARDILASIEDVVIAVNRNVDDPAMRVARASCSYLRFAVDDPVRARILIQLLGGLLKAQGPRNENVVADISAGILAGRFRIATLEAGVVFVTGVTQMALVHVTHRPTESTIALAQQLVTMTLTGLGLPRSLAGVIAAQASEDIIRRSPSTPGSYERIRQPAGSAGEAE